MSSNSRIDEEGEAIAVSKRKDGKDGVKVVGLDVDEEERKMSNSSFWILWWAAPVSCWTATCIC